MEKKCRINRENEIKVKSEPGHVISKLVFYTTAENVFLYNSWKRDCDEKWGHTLSFMIPDLVSHTTANRSWASVLQLKWRHDTGIETCFGH